MRSSSETSADGLRIPPREFNFLRHAVIFSKNREMLLDFPSVIIYNNICHKDSRLRNGIMLERVETRRICKPEPPSGHFNLIPGSMKKENTISIDITMKQREVKP